MNNHTYAQRYHINVFGRVQGVGFRPFVSRLAHSMRLNGWVENNPRGVAIEIEGPTNQLQSFLFQLESQKPQPATIEHIDQWTVPRLATASFEIRASTVKGARTAPIIPDLATCNACTNEIFDPTNRRYLYPFTNCTHCGPRYSIINALPYDRANTTLAQFVMCCACQQEYDDPHNRRFHAQPNACPACGPQVALWDKNGPELAAQYGAIGLVCDALSEGKIVAMKGIGGFHLLVDATNAKAVANLRQRKRRPDKPLAVMFRDIRQVRHCCQVTSQEAALLDSPASPIVILKRLAKARKYLLTPTVAPHNPTIGAMLAYSPLHKILLNQYANPVVATSGNHCGDPICIDETVALVQLQGIADMFLVHNRPIARQVDDSVTQIVADRTQVLRLARGYAPLSLQISNTNGQRKSGSILAVGAHFKNAIAVGYGNTAILSQHLGDMESLASVSGLQETIDTFNRIYQQPVTTVVCDQHPNYKSTQLAKKMDVPALAVQHHHAHIAACMLEHNLTPPLLGICWDGNGYGADATLWGGEFLEITKKGFNRHAFFRRFSLPGGDLASREPRRAALGLLYEIFGAEVFAKTQLAPIKAFTEKEKQLLQQALEKRLHAPQTSSVGRLFDAIASLLDIYQLITFEGQAAMQLEFCANSVLTTDYYPFTLDKQNHVIIDWEPMIRQILIDTARQTSTSLIATKFHNTLVEIIAAIVIKSGHTMIVLTGGCFQNRYLTEAVIKRMALANIDAYWHQRVPPNDGSIALGQLVIAQYS